MQRWRPTSVHQASSVVEAILNVEGPGELELPILCEAYHQRLAEIFNHLQLPALGGAKMKQDEASKLNTIFIYIFISQCYSFLFSVY